jgi:hypothetical protein
MCSTTLQGAAQAEIAPNDHEYVTGLEDEEPAQVHASEALKERLIRLHVNFSGKTLLLKFCKATVTARLI